MRDTQGKYAYGGTGFFVSVPSEFNDSSYSTDYLVTARHCVEEAGRSGSLFVRLNTRFDGPQFKKLETDWEYSEDDGVDLAIAPFRVEGDPPLIHYALNAPAMFADAEEIKTYGIGLGDEIFPLGLFTYHYGSKRNIPILRSGVIAAMPEEPIVDDKSGLPYRAYLIEMRSIGGLSGSPVFVSLRLGPEKPRYDYDPDKTMFPFRHLLLGVIRAHWNYSRKQSGMSFGRSEFEQVNMGIAVATPVEELKSILLREDVVKERRAEELEERKRKVPKADRT